MYKVQLLSFLFALSTFPKIEAVVSYGAVLSAGFTSDMVLAMAPAKSALYGLVFAAGSNLPTVTVTVDGGDPISAIVDLTSKGPSKSANACDKACFDQGYLSFGAISCCSQLLLFFSISLLLLLSLSWVLYRAAKSLWAAGFFTLTWRWCPAFLRLPIMTNQQTSKTLLALKREEGKWREREE